MSETFEQMLSGGHPNSLGRTLEVLDIVLKTPSKLDDLYKCYFSKDEVVRLRVSNAMKRISRDHIDWLVPYIDRLIDEISKINQASTQWTLAELYRSLRKFMTKDQYKKAEEILKHNLVNNKDWIVINWTMQTLAEWSENNQELKIWLNPKLEKFTQDPHRSISSRAKRLLLLIKSYTY